MKFVSLFAGIGGIDLGLERAGHECVGQVEIDPYCQKVLARHWPTTPRIADVRDFHGHEFGPFDLLTGGYPCQPFSKAGNRRGEDDPRHLWPEVHRIIRNVRPKFVLLENVPGHLSLGFGRVLGDLAESGYDAEWDCLPAAAVGAPHVRDRVFIVAWPQQPGVLADSGSGRRPDDGLRAGRHEPRTSRPHLADADSTGRQGSRHTGTGRRPVFAGARVPRNRQWTPEPDVRRVVDGLPDWSHRIRALGNAVVPQVAELIGRRLPA